MTQPLRASIVVTNHNYARYVGTAVESALAQAGGPVEVIVVDDGSTDDTLDALSGFADRITLISQSNQGQGAAFNRGWLAATGDVVLFLDADDVLEPDVVDRALRMFRDDPSVAKVQFPLYVIDESGSSLDDMIPPQGVSLAVGDVRRQLARYPDDLVWQPTSGNAFRADVLAEILPMPTEPYRICADYYLSNLSAAHGTIGVLDRPGGSYRVHGANRHYARRWSMDTLRSGVVRTSITHSQLYAECRRVGLDGLPEDPDAVRSVTAVAHRMLSLRIDPEMHPVTADTRLHLMKLGLRSAVGRDDLSPQRRLLTGGWFIAAATAPRRTLPLLARPVIALEA